MSAKDQPEVGSLAQETARLLGAVSGWAAEHGASVGDGLSGLTSQVKSAADGLDDHIATGAPECTVCPICRTVHAVRGLNPEVRTHLSTAVASLAHAATALLATSAPQDSSSRGPVEHIDLDADDWDTQA